MHMLLNAAGYDVPSWVRRGALYDFDWPNNRFHVGHTIQKSQDGSSDRMKSTFSGGGNSTNNTLFAPHANGLYDSWPSDALRRTTLGLWCETTSNTNYVGNCRILNGTGWSVGATITVNATNIPGADGAKCSAVTKSAVGSGYAVNDLITLTGGIVVKVASVTGSGINALTIIDKAIGAYPTVPANPLAQVSTTGAGTGATVTITWSTAASRLTAGAVSATNNVSFPITVTSRTLTSGAIMRRVTGSGPVWISTDGGTTKTDISGSLNTSTYVQVQIPAQTMANPTFWIQIDTNGDVVDVDFCMCANAIDSVTSLATPIYTSTSSSLTRVGEALFWNNPSVADGYNNGWPLVKDIVQKRSYSLVLEVTGNGTSSPLLAGTDQSFLFIGALNSGPVTISDYSGHSLASANSGVGGLGNINKAGFAVSDGSSIVGLNGVVTTGGVFRQQTVTNGNLSTIVLTNGGSGGTPGTYALGFAGGAGSGAAGTYTIDGTGAVVLPLNITNNGTSYTSAPTVSFPSGGVTGATATAVLNVITNTHGGLGSHNNSSVASNSVNGYFKRCTVFPFKIPQGLLQDCVT